MGKKQIRFKIYRHECSDCGHSTWRDYVIEDAVCSECGSPAPPKVTEDELVKEIVMNDTYTPEDYENAKRIAQEIVDGKPLEEIEGLNLGDAYDSSEDMRIFKMCFGHSKRIALPLSLFFNGFCGIMTHKDSETQSHYY